MEGAIENLRNMSQNWVNGQVFEEVQDELKKKFSELNKLVSSWTTYLDAKIPQWTQQLGEFEATEKDLRGKSVRIGNLEKTVEQMDLQMQKLRAEILSRPTTGPQPNLEMYEQALGRLDARVQRLLAELEDRTDQLQRLQADYEFKMSQPQPA